MRYICLLLIAGPLCAGTVITTTCYYADFVDGVVQYHSACNGYGIPRLESTGRAGASSTIGFGDQLTVTFSTDAAAIPEWAHDANREYTLGAHGSADLKMNYTLVTEGPVRPGLLVGKLVDRSFNHFGTAWTSGWGNVGPWQFDVVDPVQIPRLPYVWVLPVTLGTAYDFAFESNSTGTDLDAEGGAEIWGTISAQFTELDGTPVQVREFVTPEPTLFYLFPAILGAMILRRNRRLSSKR